MSSNCHIRWREKLGPNIPAPDCSLILLDDHRRPISQHFSDAELITLTMAVATINTWNRLNVSFRVEAGSYKSRRQPAAEKVGA